MQDVKEIKIIGIDSKRPPILRKEPYIDLVFELSVPTSKQWNEDFIGLFNNSEVRPKIDATKSLFIQTWTRTMVEIPEHVELLKTKVIECNQIASDRQAAVDLLAMSGSKSVEGAGGPQGQLNAIIASLNFD